MTPEMAFECLLVTADPAVFSTIEDILQDFSIATRVCPYPSKASPLLQEGSTDLVVIDLEAEASSDLLAQIAAVTNRQKPTVLGVSKEDCLAPSVHVVLRKPVTHEAGFSSVRVAYSRMLRDYRKHTRFAVMSQVLATDDENRIIPLTVTNIGEGGVGLATVESLRIGSVLRFRLRLPDLTNEILIQARVLWVRPYGAAGCEFVHLPQFDLQLLRAWLESKYRIKKPLILV
jgi:Tfp pilus assembly protein PilZ/glutaredoxin